MADRIQKIIGPRGTSYLVRVEYPPDPVTGKRRQRSKSFTTKKEAEKELAKWLVEIERGTAIEGSKMTVGEYLLHWVDTVARHNVRVTTYESYRWMIAKHIIPTLGSVPLQKLTAAQVQGFYSEKLSGGASPRLVHLCHLRLRQALTQAVKWNMVSRNVTDAVDAPTVRYKRGGTWTPAEARTFLAAALSDGYSPLWHLALATGMRRGELLGLRWQDVDEKRGTIAVFQNVVAYKGAALIQEPKTPAARRTVILDPMCLSLLRAHRKRQAARQLAAGPEWRNLDLIFTTPDGGPINPNNVSRNFAVIMQRAEQQRKAEHLDSLPLPRIRFHDMRHTHATLLLQEGEAVHTVSARLGHANAAITLSIYAHVTPSMQESAASTIGRLLSEAAS